MLLTIKKIVLLLNKKERKKSIILLLMIIVMALLDMLGVASILPFISIITNPDIIDTNVHLNKIFLLSNKFGIKNENQFLLAMGISVFLLLIISLSFKTFTLYTQLRFIQMRRYSLGRRVLQNFLHQPYSWFLNRNSSDLGKLILSEVGEVVSKGLRPLFELISRSLIVFVLISLLLFINLKVTFLVSFIIGGAYLLYFVLTKNYLYKIGKDRFKNNTILFKAISEAFGAIKEIKIGGLENVYIKRFSDPAIVLAKKEANLGILSQLPRYILEALTFGGIILMILYLIFQKGTFNSALPTISLFVFAGYRILPSIQQINLSLNQITYVSTAVNSLYSDLCNHVEEDTKIKKNIDKILLNKSIDLKKIYYSYPNSSKPALIDINMHIPAKRTVGLMGTTGSGKTTTVDIITGLLEAQNGTLEIDGKIITKNNYKNWQLSIGYVPQNVYLIDDNILANIALGTSLKNIRQDWIEKVSKIANLHDFVVNELPNKYFTKVGDRGVRLSGGQKQRIGIARALYHNPSIIILDEATSSLDNFTEKLVMDAIENLSQNKTLIIIAHRLSTLKNCDKIFEMENGKIINEGTFKELVESKNILY